MSKSEPSECEHTSEYYYGGDESMKCRYCYRVRPTTQAEKQRYWKLR